MLKKLVWCLLFFIVAFQMIGCIKINEVSAPVVTNTLFISSTGEIRAVIADQGSIYLVEDVETDSEGRTYGKIKNGLYIVMVPTDWREGSVPDYGLKSAEAVFYDLETGLTKVHLEGKEYPVSLILEDLYGQCYGMFDDEARYIRFFFVMDCLVEA